MSVKIEGLSRTSVVLLEQIRTIDRTRLRTYVNSVDNEVLQQIDKALKILKIMYQMKMANKIEKEYYTDQERLAKFLDDFNGQEILI